MAKGKGNVPSSPKTVGRAPRWNKFQNKIINETLPDWHTFSIDMHGNLKGNDSTLTDWKKQRADVLLARAEFQTLPDEMDLAEARQALLRKWTNYRATKLDTTSTSNAPQVTALKAAASALCDLRAYSKGKSLFKEQNEARIKTRQNQILGQNPNMSQIGAYQTALKDLWRQEDQEHWEAKADASTEDVFRNQRDFPDHMYQCLRALCRVGGVGRLEAVLLIAFRDREDVCQSYCLEAHHDDTIKNFSQTESGTGIDRKFGLWAQTVIPESSDSKRSGFEKSDAGIPLFASVCQEEPPSVLRQTILTFVEELWQYSQADEKALPWEALSAKPDEFYDTRQFKLSTPLRHPSNLSNSEIYLLCEDLARLSTDKRGSPFVFYSRMDGIQEYDPPRPEELNNESTSLSESDASPLQSNTPTELLASASATSRIEDAHRESALSLSPRSHSAESAHLKETQSAPAASGTQADHPHTPITTAHHSTDVARVEPSRSSTLRPGSPPNTEAELSTSPNVKITSSCPRESGQPEGTTLTSCLSLPPPGQARGEALSSTPDDTSQVLGSASPEANPPAGVRSSPSVTQRVNMSGPTFSSESDTEPNTASSNVLKDPRSSIAENGSSPETNRINSLIRPEGADGYNETDPPGPAMDKDQITSSRGGGRGRGRGRGRGGNPVAEGQPNLTGVAVEDSRGRRGGRGGRGRGRGAARGVLSANNVAQGSPEDSSSSSPINNGPGRREARRRAQAADSSSHGETTDGSSSSSNKRNTGSLKRKKEDEFEGEVELRDGQRGVVHGRAKKFVGAYFTANGTSEAIWMTDIDKHITLRIAPT